MASGVKVNIAEAQEWREIVSRYNFPDTKRSIWQLINSIIPFLAIWILMYFSLQFSYWIAIILSFPAAGFMIRIFIIFHDCVHKSFFKSSRWNVRIGFLTGLFTFTPYYKWHREHNKHHATVGNLDKRGIGDVLTMTADEFKSSSRAKRVFYRIYRNPLIMIFVAPPIVFIVQNRFFSKGAKSREKWNSLLTTLTSILIITGISLLIGFRTFVIIQLPILYISSVCGVWLFYLQHQYSAVHWYRDSDWVYETVALEGCSFYKLPRLLQWFTGSIGFHHVHHLSSRIPNYKLEKCHKENALFEKVKPLTLLDGFKSAKLRVWDENAGKLLSFKEAGC